MTELKRKALSCRKKEEYLGKIKKK